MLSRKILPPSLEVEEVLDIYFKSCSLMVNVKNLANMSYCISNNGVSLSGEKVIEPEHARILRTLMATCGTYDYSEILLLELEFRLRVELAEELSQPQ